MSLRMALLGLLTASGPASGYDLAKRFENSINYAWHAGHSQIYPELAKMAADGLVTVGEEGPRGRKTYTVTEEGYRLLHGWLATEKDFRPVRDEGALRSFLLPLLEPEESVALLRREARVYGARLAELEAVEASKPREQGSHFGRYALDLGIRQLRMMRDWAEETADRIEHAARG
ncbi:PadR family transcriptional regulator [Planomonospora algeriensis]